jgi:hypothetical protein
MQTVQIKTLIDITKNKNLRMGQGTAVEADQYRNFITLLQCTELRSIVSYNTNPSLETVDVEELGFGSKYKGLHSVWSFTIFTDRDDVYLDGKNPIGKLVEDIHAVPIIKSLTETINIDKAIFDCKDIANKNTLILLMSNNDQ